MRHSPSMVSSVAAGMRIWCWRTWAAFGRVWRETAEQETLIRPLLRDPVLGREKGRLTGAFN